MGTAVFSCMVWDSYGNKIACFYHIVVNVICKFGALFFFNLGSVIKGRLGKGGFREILISPVQKQWNN
jgi:hypothetical protein